MAIFNSRSPDLSPPRGVANTVQLLNLFLNPQLPAILVSSSLYFCQTTDPTSVHTRCKFCRLSKAPSECISLPSSSRSLPLSPVSTPMSLVPQWQWPRVTQTQLLFGFLQPSCQASQSGRTPPSSSSRKYYSDTDACTLVTLLRTPVPCSCPPVAPYKNGTVPTCPCANPSQPAKPAQPTT